MPDLHIALSGLQVAQRALETIGTNIANASTAGYHRQELEIAPLRVSVLGKVAIGGATIAEARRLMDVLLENQLLRQRPKLGQALEEMLTLRSLESAMGDLSSGALVNAITDFFGALRELTARPDSQPLQEQAVMAADALAKRFNSLGQFLQELDQQIRLEAEELIGQVNHLASEIATLNHDIGTVLARGGSPNLLLDRRDQAVTELAELADVQAQTMPGQPGIVNVVVWGTPLVVRSTVIELEVGVPEGDKLGVSVKDADCYQTGLSGGRLGGLLSLKNTVVAEIQDRLDTLASEIIYNVNRHHVQGVGSAGSFAEILSQPLSGTQLADWDTWGTYLNEGTLYVRVTDQTVGSATQHAISVAGDDTAQTIAAKLDAVDGLTGGVVGSALRIGVEDQVRYRFDFLPAPVTVCQAGWSGTVQPAVGGIYTGQDDKLLTCTVTADGTVGVTDGVSIEVRDESGGLVATLNVGTGYAAGDRLEVADGLHAALAAGTLTAGEQFTVNALAHSDSSGFLAAAGINTFFKGNALLDMAVNDALLARPGRLACAVGENMNDNTNVRRMAEAGDQQLPALGDMSCADACRTVITSIAQRIQFAESRHSSLGSTIQQLLNQRDDISGVDVNDEAGKMLMFERMYQALAKLINTQQRALEALLEML